MEYNRSRVVAQQGENLVNLVNAKKIQKEPANTMLQKEKGKLCEINNNEDKIIKDILDEYIIWLIILLKTYIFVGKFILSIEIPFDTIR